MLGRSVGIVAIGAASAAAFLLPPGFSPATDALSVSPTLTDGKSHVFALPCSECAFGSTQEKIDNVEDGHDTFWIQGGAHELLLNFTVSDDGKSLYLGGSPIYALDASAEPQFGDFQVSQVPSGLDAKDLKPEQITPLHVTSCAISILDTDLSSDMSGEGSVERVGFEITGLDGKNVNPGGADVTLIKTPNEGLVILTVVAHPASALGSMGSTVLEDMFAPEHGQPAKEIELKDCKGLPAPLCKFKNAVEAHFHALKNGAARKFRPCPGRKGKGHGRPHGRLGQNGRPMHHHGRPHHMRPHDRHHKHHQFRAFFRAFTRGFLAVLVPIVTGVAMGMCGALLGLALSRVISFVWMKFSRGGSRGSYTEVSQAAYIVEDGSKIAIAEMEAPPTYDDARAYDEVEKV